MDISLITTGAMTLLKPLLEKAGEKAAETIGEKLAEKTVEQSFWHKVKGLFIIEEEKQTVQAIESKPVATQQEVTLIERKLTKEINSNPQFAAEMQATFNLSSTNIFVAEQLLKSIQADRLKIVELFEDKRLAGIETEGSYEIMIKRTRKRLEKDEKEFINLITVP
jgi:hypothetical protein